MDRGFLPAIELLTTNAAVGVSITSAHFYRSLTLACDSLTKISSCFYLTDYVFHWGGVLLRRNTSQYLGHSGFWTSSYSPVYQHCKSLQSVCFSNPWRAILKFSASICLLPREWQSCRDEARSHKIDPNACTIKTTHFTGKCINGGFSSNLESSTQHLTQTHSLCEG